MGALLDAKAVHRGAAVAHPVLGEWASFDVRDTAGDVLAVGAYLMLISLFTLGPGALRGTVATLTTVFLVIAVLPMTLALTDMEFCTRIADAMPAVGLALLAGWAVAALLAGYVVLRRRDA